MPRASHRQAVRLAPGLARGYNPLRTAVSPFRRLSVGAVASSAWSAGLTADRSGDTSSARHPRPEPCSVL